MDYIQQGSTDVYKRFYSPNARLENAELYDLEHHSDSILSPQTSASSYDEASIYNEPSMARSTINNKLSTNNDSTTNKKKSHNSDHSGKIVSTLKQEIETYADKAKKMIKSLTSNKWLSIALAVVIVLVICVLFIFLPKTSVFYKPDPSIELILKEHGERVKKEILEKIKSQETSVIPICTKAALYTKDFPETYKMLEEIPQDISYAGIISLKPYFFQTKYNSYGPNANKTYRYFYVISESSVGCSGIWVDGEKKIFSSGGIICADVSRESCLFNECVRRNAIVIFFDVITNRKPGVSMTTDIYNDDLLKHFILDNENSTAAPAFNSDPVSTMTNPQRNEK